MLFSSFRQRFNAAITHIFTGWRSPALVSSNALSTAFASLPEPSRTVYLLHARDQLSMSDVARRLNLTPSEAERHLASALVHLDRQIGPISPVDAVAYGSLDR